MAAPLMVFAWLGSCTTICPSSCACTMPCPSHPGDGPNDSKAKSQKMKIQLAPSCSFVANPKVGRLQVKLSRTTSLGSAFWDERILVHVCSS